MKNKIEGMSGSQSLDRGKRSPERQSQETSKDRRIKLELENMRFLRSVPPDASSSSNTYPETPDCRDEHHKVINASPSDSASISSNPNNRQNDVYNNKEEMIAKLEHTIQSLMDLNKYATREELPSPSRHLLQHLNQLKQNEGMHTPFSDVASSSSRTRPEISGQKGESREENRTKSRDKKKSSMGLRRGFIPPVTRNVEARSQRREHHEEMRILSSDIASSSSNLYGRDTSEGEQLLHPDHGDSSQHEQRPKYSRSLLNYVLTSWDQIKREKGKEQSEADVEILGNRLKETLLLKGKNKDEKMKIIAGQFLNRDLSDVPNEIYSKACSIAMVAMEERIDNVFGGSDEGATVKGHMQLRMENLLMRGGGSKRIDLTDHPTNDRVIYQQLERHLPSVFDNALRQAPYAIEIDQLRSYETLSPNQKKERLEKLTKKQEKIEKEMIDTYQKIDEYLREHAEASKMI